MKNMISVCRICSIQRWIVLLVVTLVLFSGISLTAQEDPIEVISRLGFSNARAALQHAIISNNIELAQAAVAMGEDLNVIYEIPYGYYSKRYMTPLAAALEFGADITIIEALLHYGADPNDTILTNDLPALFIAGQRDMTNIVLLFYSAGADLRRTLPSGDTLMHVAAASNNLATVQLLHRIGLQLVSTNALGKTAVDIAPENTAVKKYLIQLRLREEYENKQAYIYGGLQTNVSEMLAENELKKGGWTRDSASFMRALTSLNERIVFCYIRTGFDPFASEKYKPIQSGSERGADKLVRLLVQHAREQGKLDDISEQLEYSLFTAAASNNERIVTMIMNVDIDVDTLNQEGNSPLLVALQCNAYDAAEALIKAGAATNKRAVREALKKITTADIRTYFDTLVARASWEIAHMKAKTTGGGPVVVGPKPLTKYTDKAGITMVYIPAGTFLMGSPANEYERKDDEGHQRNMYVSGLWMDECEVTQESYEQLMGTNPSQHKDRRYPVDSVPWEVAIKYCNKRSELDNLPPAYTESGLDWSSGGYRLPTEAEWEYACRAGTKTPFSTGEQIDTSQANYDGRAPYLASQREQPRNMMQMLAKATAFKGCPVPVKSTPANPWALYDLHGNVCEWVNDGYGPYDMATTNNPRGASSGPCPVLRGGSWMHAARGVRSARRINLSVENTPGNCIGFRCVRTSHKNIPLVTQGLANEIAFRSLMKDYAPQLLVAKYSLTTNELVYPSALLKKGFIWQCGSCGTINDVTSYRPGEATMCQCGQGAIITGVKACNIATCPACGVKHNVAKATQGLFTCRNKECDTAFLVADQSTRLAAAQRKHLPQFVAIAQDAIALRTKAIIAVMRMDSNEQCSKQLSDYIAAQMLGALNDESTRTPREIEVVDRTAIKTVMNELELQKIYGEPETRKQISQQLNADVLLASDIKVADDVLVLTVKVVDVENGKLLLTKTTEIPITPRLRDLNKK